MMSTKLGKIPMVLLLLLVAGTLQAGTITLTGNATGAELSTLLLLGSGLVGLIRYRRMKRMM